MSKKLKKYFDNEKATIEELNSLRHLGGVNLIKLIISGFKMKSLPRLELLKNFTVNPQSDGHHT